MYLEDWDEDVSVVVGTFVLNDRDQSLEAHATIDVFSRKGPQGAILQKKFYHQYLKEINFVSDTNPDVLLAFLYLISQPITQLFHIGS